jgi:hypothetical protein
MWRGWIGLLPPSSQSPARWLMGAWRSAGEPAAALSKTYARRRAQGVGERLAELSGRRLAWVCP